MKATIPVPIPKGLIGGTFSLPKAGPRLVQAIALAAIVACLALVISLLAAALPKIWGYNSFVIYSSSMEPTISVGSLIVAQPVAVDRIQKGDIIAFRSPSNGVTLTHRVVGIRQEGGLRHFQVKGDASKEANPPEMQLQGRVYKFAYELPYLGYFVHFAKSSAGIVLLLVLPAVGLLLSYSMHFLKPPEGQPRGETQS